MIIDPISHSSIYQGIHPLFEACFSYLEAADLGSLACGNRELPDIGGFVQVSQYVTRSASSCRLEDHEKSIDIPLADEPGRLCKPVCKIPVS